MHFQLVAVYAYNLITWQEEAEESRHSGTAEQMAVVSTWRGLDFSFSYSPDSITSRLSRGF